jgi:hypothetical protein
MNPLRLIFVSLVATLLAGCDSAPKVPNAAQKNYPVIIHESADNRAKAEREWRRLLDTYTVAQTPPDLHPIIYTPRSLLGVTGGIKLLAAPPERGSETVALREAMKTFLDRWRDLLNADPSAVSLISGNGSGNGTGATQRLTYRQANYGFPVAGNYGEITAVISSDGRLLQLDDRFIPTIELPQRPQIAREDAQKRVVGRSFTYTDIAGREQRVQVANANDVTVKQLVVLPIQKGDNIEVHLAWEVTAGRSLSWTVYLDAITGDELRAVQNFQT